MFFGRTGARSTARRHNVRPGVRRLRSTINFEASPTRLAADRLAAIGCRLRLVFASAARLWTDPARHVRQLFAAAFGVDAITAPAAGLLVIGQSSRGFDQWTASSASRSGISTLRDACSRSASCCSTPAARSAHGPDCGGLYGRDRPIPASHHRFSCHRCADHAGIVGCCAITWCTARAGDDIAVAWRHARSWPPCQPRKSTGTNGGAEASSSPICNAGMAGPVAAIRAAAAATGALAALAIGRFCDTGSTHAAITSSAFHKVFALLIWLHTLLWRYFRESGRRAEKRRTSAWGSQAAE